MEARQMFGTVHRGVSPRGSPSILWPAHGVQSAGLGALTPSNGTCGTTSSSNPNAGGFNAGLRSSHVARTAQWSAIRSDSSPPPLGKRLTVKPDSGAVPEPHKVFDEALIVVKSGRGGNGEVVPSGRGRYVPNHKYKPGGNQPKQIWLPASDPGDGADGGDVVLVCDPGVDSLLHLHQGRKGGKGSGGPSTAAVVGTFCAPDGANANPNTGSGGPKRNLEIKKARTPALEIPVPPGTVVKRRGTGALLGELLQPGQRLTVVRGGEGGHGVVAPSRQQRRARISRAEREARDKGVELVEVEDDGWRSDSRGQSGQQLTLALLLRVVADVGMVGFPNAGKSSLLKALTRASPTIAPYPFTTLMPNLGVLSAGGGATKAVLADLPGLIEGAHAGRGLGRNFLRHLRRTRALLHVVDSSAPDPATDYCAVREELRMYNSEYCARPHVVVLNKTDLLQQPQSPPSDGGAPERRLMESLVAAIREAARRQVAEHTEGSYDGPAPVEPLAVVPCSAATGEGLQELAAALQRAIGASCVSEPDIVRPVPDTLVAAQGQAVDSPSADDGADGAAATDAAAVAGTVAATAAAAATAAGAAAAARLPRVLPPPPPPSPGWDDADSGDADGAWGRLPSSQYDDAAAELGEGELEQFTERCREMGLMDEGGNFLTHRSTSSLPAADGDDDGADGFGAAGSLRKIHDALDEQEQFFLDEHTPSGAAPGDGAPDDDEWVELSALDEETLAAVLDELERSDADGEGPLLQLGFDVRLAPPPQQSEAASPQSQGSVDGDFQQVATTSVSSSSVVSETEARRPNAAMQRRQQQQQEGGSENDEGLVQMAPSDDPDARLINLSLEELLALEKDW